MNGWRTLNIETAARLSVSDNQLMITDIATSVSGAIPLDELARVIVSTHSAIITASLIEQLAMANVCVLFCDNKHNPACEILPVSRHENAAGCILDQAAWQQERKDTVWAELVRLKIGNQIRALEKCGCAVPDHLSEYLNAVEDGDADNREALAARCYFSAMFGRSFIRHGPDNTNAALNYGYALIMSAVSRALVIHGYNTALGIHHVSRSNRFNLSCDIMEPFRPFVDVAVFKRRWRSLDKFYKRELIELLNQHVIYDRKRRTMDDAISEFTLRVCKQMNGEGSCLPEVYFA